MILLNVAFIQSLAGVDFFAGFIVALIIVAGAAVLPPAQLNDKHAQAGFSISGTISVSLFGRRPVRDQHREMPSIAVMNESLAEFSAKLFTFVFA